MFYGRTVAVIIPAYRVEKWIVKVINGLPAFVDRIIVVDDASPDNVARVVTDLNHPKVKLIKHKRNLGVGGAMKSGFREAIEEGIDLIVKMDGDDQMDPVYLGPLLYPLVKKECDYIKGNRFGILSNIKNMPVVRRIGSLVLTLLNKFASGYWHVVDPQNGYIGIRGDVLRRLNLKWIDNSYFFENSMLINLNIVEAKVSDMLMPSRYGDEESSMDIFTIAIKFPLKLVKGFFFRLFFRYFYCDFSPVFVFFVLGMAMMCGGGVWGAIAWYKSVYHEIITEIGTFALGLIPLLMGFQFCMNALILDVQQSPRGKEKSYDYSDRERKLINDRLNMDYESIN
ncbi:glycosyltransferase family 2 protein [bacterium]|nr:glycosyltransferase family 2 protein [bacterium]